MFKHLKVFKKNSKGTLKILSLVHSSPQAHLPTPHQEALINMPVTV